MKHAVGDTVGVGGELGEVGVVAARGENILPLVHIGAVADKHASPYMPAFAIQRQICEITGEPLACGTRLHIALQVWILGEAKHEALINNWLNIGRECIVLIRIFLQVVQDYIEVIPQPFRFLPVVEHPEEGESDDEQKQQVAYEEKERYASVGVFQRIYRAMPRRNGSGMIPH